MKSRIVLTRSRNHFGCRDIFEYFKEKKVEGKLPEVEEIEAAARSLHRVFSTTAAIYEALDDVTAVSDWTSVVPEGSPWVAAPSASDKSSQGSAKCSELADDAQMDTKGDRVLSNSITFMRDALLSRELSYAIAEGDVGRVYEVIKVWTMQYRPKPCAYLFL